jgi:hypothetical protein
MRKDKLHRKGQRRRTKTLWTYKKLPTYRVAQKTPNAKISQKNFSLLSNPLVLWVAFIFHKYNKTEHLRDKELFRTTKPQKPVKLIIDNSQLSSN